MLDSTTRAPRRGRLALSGDEQLARDIVDGIRELTAATSPPASSATGGPTSARRGSTEKARYFVDYAARGRAHSLPLDTFAQAFDIGESRAS